MIAAMKKVLSPISEARMTPVDLMKPFQKDKDAGMVGARCPPQRQARASRSGDV